MYNHHITIFCVDIEIIDLPEKFTIVQVFNVFSVISSAAATLLALCVLLDKFNRPKAVGIAMGLTFIFEIVFLWIFFTMIRDLKYHDTTKQYWAGEGWGYILCWVCTAPSLLTAASTMMVE